MMTLMAVMIAIAANAQYNVGTSSRYTDSNGNSTSTHRNQYGETTGTSSSYTDSYGNTTTTHRDRYGNTIGTSSTYTDSYGNTTTTHRDRYGNTTGTDRSYTDSYGNTTTTYSDPYGQRRGTSNTYTILPLPIGTPTGKASALLQAILIRMGTPLLSNVAMMNYNARRNAGGDDPECQCSGLCL